MEKAVPAVISALVGIEVERFAVDVVELVAGLKLAAVVAVTVLVEPNRFDYPDAELQLVGLLAVELKVAYRFD